MATVAAFFPGRRAKLPGPAGQLPFRDELLKYARTLLGVPYEINLPGFPRVPGGRGLGKKYPQLDKGLDCSGYVLNVLQHMGLLADLDPDFTDCDKIFTRCNAISMAAAKPGDLVAFVGTFDTPGLSHIGIVTKAGGTEMIDAREPGVRFDALPGIFAQNAPRYARVRGMPD
jgi:cell wall-associated NlpC family hydrolase